MAAITVHIHGSFSTYDLQICNFQQLLSEIALKEGHENEKSLELRFKNELLDEGINMSTLADAHIDVKVNMIGKHGHISP